MSSDDSKVELITKGTKCRKRKKIEIKEDIITIKHDNLTVYESSDKSDSDSTYVPSDEEELTDDWDIPSDEDEIDEDEIDE